jgi:serine/threonine-protein kinase HipA
MTTLEVWLDDASSGAATQIGTLQKSSGRGGDAISFEYGTAWREAARSGSAFALDPELPVAGGRQYARAGAGRLTGAFVDCSPDRWGKRLMERREAIEARAEARNPRLLREWDFLVGVHDESRMGGLRLRDPASARYIDDSALGAPPVTELRTLEAIADRVERDNDDDASETATWLRQLIAPGASLGGARPKAGFRDTDGSLWLAKFPSADDRHDVGLWEFLAYGLSVAAGIEMPEARMLELSSRGHTFAVRRFDRVEGSRRAYASAMTLLAATESDGTSYLEIVGLIEASGTSTRIGDDLEQLFRRVLFNILIGNRDDHLRNHGFLREGNGWRLCPAFDVNPNVDRATHVLNIDETSAVPESELLMRVADYYRLDAARAASIADEVRTAVAGWEARARQLGARSREIETMRAVIDPAR